MTRRVLTSNRGEISEYSVVFVVDDDSIVQGAISNPSSQSTSKTSSLHPRRNCCRATYRQFLAA
jgi:hypothetical protein